MQTISTLAVRVRVLSPEDSIGRAAEAVRASTVGAAPVVADGRLVGLVTGAVLTRALAERRDRDPEAGKVFELELETAVVLPETLRPEDALQFFHANGIERAPVLDYSGGLVGMISQSELATAVCRRIKPPMIGGMATPFGVYLTGGGVRGGVGDLALMSTGAYLAVLNLLALAFAELLLSDRISLPQVGRAVEWLQGHDVQPLIVLGTVLFALLFRLSWVTGFHAAEHQVVHAMEAGDDLRPEIVRQKPRVHPRCGTNLVAAIGIMSLFWWMRGIGWLAWQGTEVLVAMAVTFFFWRRIGGWVQQHVTTKPATPGQLDSGIRAGRELMRRYQEGPPRGGFGRRIWNMGLLQVLSGWFIVLAVLAVLTLVRVPLPEAWRVW